MYVRRQRVIKIRFLFGQMVCTPAFQPEGRGVNSRSGQSGRLQIFFTFHCESPWVSNLRELRPGAARYALS